MYTILLCIILLFLIKLKIQKRRIVAVASACSDISDIKELCYEHDVDLIVYDKCGQCKNAPDGVKCIPRKNVGREQETFLGFVVDNYKNLPDDLLFIALPLHKHSRKDRIIHMIKNDIVGCSDSIEDQAIFTIDEHEGQTQHPSPVRPFKAWFETFVAPWNSSLKSACWNGIMKTTKERILQKPKSFYQTLLDQLSTHNSHEVAHFMERSMGSVF